METVVAAIDAATAGGYLLVLALVLPYAGVFLSLVLGGRYAERIALALMRRRSAWHSAPTVFRPR